MVTKTKTRRPRTTGKDILKAYNPTDNKKKMQEADDFAIKAMKNFKPFVDLFGDDLLFTVMEVLPSKDKNDHDEKRPLSYKKDRLVKWSNKEELLDLEDALAYVYIYSKVFPKRHFELGMVIKEPLVVLDIDDIKDELNPLSNRIKKLQELTGNTYCEVSQSGEGLHFIYKGKKIRSLSNYNGYELYAGATDKKLIILTGNTLKGFDKLNEVSSSQEQLIEDFLWGNVNTSQKEFISAVSAPSKIIKDLAKLTEDQLIEKIKTSKEFGPKFKALWTNTDGRNPSEGDQALANIIAFWTNYDLNKADTIFRKSARYREKWDTRHRSDGATYGQMTLEKAMQFDKEKYKGQTIADILNKRRFHHYKNNKELDEALEHAREVWDKDHTIEKNGTVSTIPILNKPHEVVKILLNTVDFAIIYNVDPTKDSNLYFFEYDRGVYSQYEPDLEGLILHVAPEINNKVTRQNILDTILKLRPTISNIPRVQNLTSSEKGKDLLVVGNGILNLKTLKLSKFSPEFYVTAKIDTNYNPNANKEPIFNGWSWSKSLEDIADGQEDKLELLWQTCKAGIIGAYWLRQLVMLVDDGHGKTGKSTFEDAIMNVVGRSNVADLKLIEFSTETKLIDAVDSRLIVGDDNDVNIPVVRYDYLNPVISGDFIRVRNYFHKSQSTSIHAFVLQSANGIPPFKHATRAFLNRLALIRFTHRHDNSKAADFAVKHDYICRREFKEWLLWYVINKVHLGVALTKTKESQGFINYIQVENDSITNFVETRLPKLRSTIVPCRWMYDYYATSCVLDNMADSTLSYRRFVRELLDNDAFKRRWFLSKNSRINQDDFLYSDVCDLVDDYTSTRWGKDLKTFFPLTNVTDVDSGGSKTRQKVTIEDYNKKLKGFHSSVFARKELLPENKN